MKKTFKVDIVRMAAQAKTLEVKAENEEEALETAHFLAGDLDFSGCEKSCEYDCTIIGESE